MSIVGETVTVLLPIEPAKDAMGEKIATQYESVDVENVLIQRGETSDLAETRPMGVKVDATLHFPKTFNRDLKRAKVQFWGNTYRVIGDPIPYMIENTPGTWNLPVSVERVDG
ncbi:MAG: hypothetical protein HUJ74_00380 [Lachnospiraceae bacterium]|nr:hypothetical protein [Lachnospiraceae bacterium]